MFPDALARFGFINIEAYVTQAHNAGLVITGFDSNGRTWVSLVDTIETPGSVSKTTFGSSGNRLICMLFCR
jgi:hypothetical protein